MRRIWSALLLAAVVAPLAAQLTRKAPPDVEAALKARVEKFYSLFQQGKFRQAEALVAVQSRDLFYNMSKVPIREWKYESVSFSSDFKTADVLISCLSGHPRLASAGVHVPVSGKWKLIKGQWFLLIEPLTTTPFGPMQWEDPRTAKAAQPVSPRGNIAMSVDATFEVQPQKLIFPQGKEPVSRSVLLKNNLPGPMQFEVEGANLPGLSIVTLDKNVPPKSQTSFRINYDPAAGKLTGTKEVIVRVLPLNATTTIQLQFE